MSERLAGTITRRGGWPSVTAAARLWRAGVIRHRGTLRVPLRPARGRIVMLRAGLAGICSAVLAVAAFAAPAGAKVVEPGRQAAGRALPAAAAPGSGWSITPSPNPLAGNGALNTVSCPTTSVCTAVGLHVTESGLGVTLAERRSGSAWTVESTPNPAGAAASALNGVSCPSSSACTAVGAFFAGSGAQLTLAERWDGTSWAIQPTPNPAGSPSSILSAVACPAADTCTAVGTSNSQVLVERRDGASWRIQPAPVPSGAQFSELNGVSCTAGTCIAVGDYVNASGLDVTLAERWNGTSWTIQPTPNPSAAQSFSTLIGASCIASDACEAVGASDAGLVAERWNGTSWSLQTVPAPTGAQRPALVSVSCTASSCEAVGGYADSSGAFVTLGEGWDGTAWHAQPTPNPAQASSNSLGGVSCPSPSDCTAVGLANGAGTPITLGERWRNGSWSLEALPSPAGAAENQLNGIACPATDACIAVGTAGPTQGVVSTEALRWNGTTWQLQQIPPLPGTGLDAVSCVTETDCVAVGGPGAGALAEQWDGAKWTVQPTPKPAGAQLAGFNAISCASASSCMAVGGYIDATGAQFVLAEQWNGHSWSVVPAPTPSSPPNSFFTGVACTASAACIGVGASIDASGNPAGTFAERWDGSSWTIQPTPTQGTPGGILGSVWCTSVTACIATGSTNAGTLAEQLSGTTWSVLPTPNPPGTQGDFLDSVSCTSLSACTSVGLAFAAPAGFPPQTLAERWDGSSWTIQPTPLLPGVHDVGLAAVACPAQSACIAVGGWENDGPGSKTLTELWQGNGTAAAQTAPAASPPRAYRGIAGCIRAAIGEGLAIGAAATRLGLRIKALMPPGSQAASEIEQITSLCSAA
jgi:hypothetical protein